MHSHKSIRSCTPLLSARDVCYVIGDRCVSGVRTVRTTRRSIRGSRVLTICSCTEECLEHLKFGSLYTMHFSCDCITEILLYTLVIRENSHDEKTVDA